MPNFDINKATIARENIRNIISKTSAAIATISPTPLAINTTTSPKAMNEISYQIFMI